MTETAFEFTIALLVFWIIPAIIINIVGIIICFYENEPPIYVRDVFKSINSLDYSGIRWIPIINILFVMVMIAVFIDSLETVKKLKNKIYNIKIKSRKRIESIKLKGVKNFENIRLK